VTNADAKTDPRIVRSKTALRDALLQLMANQPFSSVSITDIVKQANYNRGTFYANYGSKDELLADMIAMKIEDLLQAFRAPYKNASVFYPHELHAQSVLIFDHIARNAEFYTTLTKSDALPALREKMFGSLKQIIIEELVHGDDAGVDPELSVIYSLHALLGLIFHWIESGFAHSPAYMQDQLVKIINQRPNQIGIHSQRRNTTHE